MRCALILAFAIFAHPAFACEAPLGWQAMQSDRGTETEVFVKLPSEPIKTGEQFDVEIMVCDEALDAAQIGVDAIMPAHKHGMNYLTVVSKMDDKAFRGSGMFFHMPGQWQVTIELKGEATRRFFLDVTAR